MSQVIDDVTGLLRRDELPRAAELLGSLPPDRLVDVIDRLAPKHQGLAFRLLEKDVAAEVFDGLDPAAQSALVDQLHDAELGTYLEDMDPDDRVALFEELPARVVKRLIRQLSPEERELTNVVLGFPSGSVGRRMSPEFLHLSPAATATEALSLIHRTGHRADTLTELPVTDTQRHLLGMVRLSDIVLAEPSTSIGSLITSTHSARATEEEEQAARRTLDLEAAAMPVVDGEERLIGLLTADDATRIVLDADAIDAARAGGTELLDRPYLNTPVFTVARSRVVWLLVLAVSAIFTVQVLEVFEATLDKVVTLALFIPLLTGIGGNTGSQAATTVTRALAMNEVRPRDVLKVAGKEARTGLSLGAVLAVVGFSVAGLIYGVDMGTVIGLTIVSVCTIAATVGGAMPLLAKSLGVDPAVFSTPFISTFCDASGLLVYFTIAKLVLGI